MNDVFISNSNLVENKNKAAPVALNGTRGFWGKLLFVIFVLSFAFDFKGKVGGSSFQYVMAGTNAVCFLGLLIKYRFSFPYSGLRGFVFLSWVLFIIFGSVVSFDNHVLIGHYSRTVYPFILFAEGLMVAYWAGQDKEYVNLLTESMFWTALIASVFTVWWGFHATELSIERIRYQILSPLLPFLMAVGLYDLFISRSNRVLAVLALVFCGALILISVTRGMFLVLLMLIVGLFVSWFLAGIRNKLVFSKRKVRTLFWTSLFAGSVIVVSVIAVPDLWGRWVYRLFGNYHLVSLWTRVAAVAGQSHEVMADIPSMLLGKGFGHSYHYASEYAPVIGPYWDNANLTVPMWYPGEFMWITPFFYGGIFVGSLVFGVFLMSLVRAVLTMTALIKTGLWSGNDVRAIWVGALGFLAFLGNSFTSNPFIFRQSAMFMGLCMGLIFIWQTNSLKLSNASA